MTAVLMGFVFGCLCFLGGIWSFQWGYRCGRRSVCEDMGLPAPKAEPPSPTADTLDPKKIAKAVNGAIERFGEPNL